MEYYYDWVKKWSRFLSFLFWTIFPEPTALAYCKKFVSDLFLSSFKQYQHLLWLSIIDFFVLIFCDFVAIILLIYERILSEILLAHLIVICCSSTFSLTFSRQLFLKLFFAKYFAIQNLFSNIFSCFLVFTFY